MSVNIYDLPNELLVKIFEYLPYKEMVRNECVCTKWQECVLLILRSEENLQPIEWYSTKFQVSFGDGQSTFGGGQMTFSYIDQTNIELFKSILKKRPNIKSIDLGIKIFTKNVLLTIANLCPKIEKISFANMDLENNIKLYDNFYQLIQSDSGPTYRQKDIETSYCFDEYIDEIKQFAKIFGPKLVCCNLENYYIDLRIIIIKELKNIQEIKLKTQHLPEEQLYFQCLKSCKNLKTLKWVKKGNYQSEKTDDMLKTIEKVNNLNIDVKIFLKINFNFSNLTELTLRGGDFDVTKPEDEIVFENVKKLTIKYCFDSEMICMSKLIFPKLQVFIVKETPLRISFPTSFINRIKHIKQLTTNRFREELIDSLEAIEVIELHKYKCYSKSFIGFSDEYFIDLICDFNILSDIKSLKKVVIKTTSQDFIYFEDIIAFKQNSNADLTFEVYFMKDSQEDQELFDRFKDQFEETKQFTGFNMKMCFV